RATQIIQDAQFHFARISMSKGHAVLRFTRKVHLYLGIFTTPALLFFAFTGAMQTFNLHESTAGSSYKPPAWVLTLAQLHKTEAPTVLARRPRPGAQDPPKTNAKPAESSVHGTEAASSAPGEAARDANSTASKISPQGESSSAGKSGGSQKAEPPSGPR